MNNMIVSLFKIIRRTFYSFIAIADYILTRMQFISNGVKVKSFNTSGVPYIMVARDGKMSVGRNFAMNNGIKGNPIGCYDRCTFFVDRNAVLTICDNVGLSQTALICHKSITICNNVKIGGGVRIYDTDFHSLVPFERISLDDQQNKVCKPVVIEDNAFIGAYSIILKGVTIGRNSIVGAGSVVTKSVPENEVWAGNPAKFIRAIDDTIM